jgi:xanthine dehydrogenase molybdopterin binding subunit
MENSNLAHNSILHHITGKSIYVNDIALSKAALHAVPFYSSKAHAKIISINCNKARELKGVQAIINYQSIPGKNQMGPIKHDETCLAEDEVHFIGQAIALIAADTRDIAIKAADLIEIEYEELAAILTREDALAKGELLDAPRKIETGHIDDALKKASHLMEGEFHSKGQEHWYLETQTALCVPREGREIMVYSSTQHPSETQAIVAEVLGIPRHLVEVDVKRMGGAFGGKETQANHIAAWTALLARETGRPVKMHLTRDTDQIITGKRHAFYTKYKVGFSDDGKLEALDVVFHAKGGAALDLSMAIIERAMFHIDNAYYIPNLRVIGNAWKTNHPPNTAFRGFGAPQGIAVIENIIDRIARYLKKDAIEIRKLNFYGTKKENTTHYGQEVKDTPLNSLLEELLLSSDYQNRKKTIEEFNAQNKWKKKGIGMVPVKFGISFTTSFLNQAGALVHIYQDGSVNVNHGGTEMGQGLHTKIRQIAALTLGIASDDINITSTNTSKVPNTSATAASSGTDLNGMAVENACLRLLDRLKEAFLLRFPNSKAEIVFKDNMVKSDTDQIPFKDLTSFAYLNQISLSTTGFYRTPNIHFDREKGQGKPFHYFAYGMSLSEVEIDVFTGKHELLRSDILHDVGKSINPMLDKGQIEGAFVQGLGWVTTEEMKYADDGRLLSHSPDTYKIPTIDDIPRDFRVKLTQNTAQADNIKKSKAVGEPPFIHGLSVWLAIKDAISAVGNHQYEPDLSIPATHEAIALSIEKLRAQ